MTFAVQNRGIHCVLSSVLHTEFNNLISSVSVSLYTHTHGIQNTGLIRNRADRNIFEFLEMFA